MNNQGRGDRPPQIAAFAATAPPPGFWQQRLRRWGTWEEDGGQREI
ncbi:MAG: hypothetical protein VKJ09_09190 [Leptolyngbya sp.]|nr:hypothetical protein [Leptolyngbya sp.]